MPEGDTAYRVAANLHRALAGHDLTEFQVRTHDLADIDLRGERVSDVVPAGKHIFVRVGEWSLHSHMRMDGVWHIYRRGARWRKPGYQVRIVLGNAHYQAVGFLLSGIRLLKTSDEYLIVDRLGPDPLTPQWRQGGREKAAARVQADPRPIHVAILDQSNVAGFGNEYANEMCFLAGVNPATPASHTNALAIMKLGERLILANLHRVERTTTGNLRGGQRLHIYGRAGQPCMRCGTTVRFTRLGADPQRGRHVHWCPRCQPALSPR